MFITDGKISLGRSLHMMKKRLSWSDAEWQESSSVTRPTFVFVETANKCVSGCIVVSTKICTASLDSATEAREVSACRNDEHLHFFMKLFQPSMPPTIVTCHYSHAMIKQIPACPLDPRECVARPSCQCQIRRLSYAVSAPLWLSDERENCHSVMVHCTLEGSDTAGQERYRTITTAYYRGAMGFILMYDITNEESFGAVQDWSTQIKTYSWDNAQVILAGNKCDMEEERVVSVDSGRLLAEQLGFEFFETSAKDNINVKQTFERLVDIICDKMSESLETDPAVTTGTQGNARLTDNPPPIQQPNCACSSGRLKM
ncbi:hypothetical protein NFI96_010356 [Prochilodus magdalenae]|nr:hypothetical protein NFI96_010356 [Prochilodus magdalenae]